MNEASASDLQHRVAIGRLFGAMPKPVSSARATARHLLARRQRCIGERTRSQHIISKTLSRPTIHESDSTRLNPILVWRKQAGVLVVLLKNRKGPHIIAKKRLYNEGNGNETCNDYFLSPFSFASKICLTTSTKGTSRSSAPSRVSHGLTGTRFNPAMCARRAAR